MKLRVLVDNYTYIDEYYFGEPGVSYYIEDGEARVLFDTGYTDAVLKNAELMGIDLDGLTHIVLSHGHDDHTRGLRYMLGCGKWEDPGFSKAPLHLKKAKLLGHPGVFEPKFDGAEYIGIPKEVTRLLDLKLRKGMTSADLPNELQKLDEKIEVTLSEGVYHITDRLTYLGQIPRVNDFENKEPVGERAKCTCGNRYCSCDADGVEEKEDDFLFDDSALVYHGRDGIFVITGCSHAGICNIVEYAKKVTGENHVAGVIGGFHLFDLDERLEKTVEYLKGAKIDMLYPCHCVSLAAKAKMYAAMPTGEVGVGMSLEIE